MDVQTQIQSLIDALKADKSMAQPWKNFAVSDAIRLQAVIEKGFATTNQKPPEDLQQVDPGLARVAGCTCIPGGKKNVNCPVHGLQT